MFSVLTPTRALLIALAVALGVTLLLLFGANARAKQFKAELRRVPQTPRCSFP